MAGFDYVKDPVDRGMEEVPVSSLTCAVNDMLELAVGATTWTAATSSSVHYTKKFIVRKAVTSSDTVAKGFVVSDSMIFIAETVNNSAAADNGDRMVLTDTNTVNNTGTDSAAKEAVVIQIAPVGAAADKRILARVITGTGVNPAAA